MRTAFLAAGAATLSLVLIAPGAALAACDNTYSGAGGDWQTGANWSTGSMPTGSQEACIPAGKTVTIVENGVPTAKNVVIAAGATLQMRTQPGGSATQASFGGLDNSGTLDFIDPANPEPNDFNNLTISSDGKLINRSGGLVRVRQGTTTYTNIFGSVDNLAGGQFQINSQLRNDGTGGPNTFANAGTMSVGSSGSVSFNSGWGTTVQQTAGTFTNNGSVTSSQALNVFDFSGGSFTGNPPIVRQGQLKLTGGSGTVAVQWGAASLIADIEAGWTVRVENRGSDVVRLRIPAGTTRTNRGTIAFAKDPAAGTDARVNASIDILAGSKLINAGTIRADADAGDNLNNDLTIFAESYAQNQSYKDPTAFVQNGTLQVSHNLTVPPLTQNSGTTTVDPGRSFTAGNPYAAGDPGMVLVGGTLTGSGRVQTTTLRNTGGVVAPTPGAASNLRLSYGFLFDPGQVQGGNYTQTSGGTLRTRLAATGGGLTVGGDTKLAGTLDVAPMLGFTPAAGQTYLLVRHEPTYDPHFRTGTFDTVAGTFAPIYELDGVDVTAPGGTSSFTIDDSTVREGQIASFVVKRGNGTGTATVHWALRENGSAAASNADYGYTTISGQRPDRPQNGDLTFAAGETQKTVAIQTFGDGTPEPDETFGIHLGNPTNVPVARADALGTILNDDYDFQSVAPNVLPNTGPITLTLRGGGLTSRMKAKLRYGPDPDHPLNAISFTPSDDGLTAKVVFDTTGLKADPNWYVQLYAFDDTNYGYRPVTVENSSEGAKPYVQGVVAPKARGGVTSYDYLHFGNVGRGPSRPAFLRLSGYPAGGDVKVDHLPASASYTLLDGVAGRTVLVSLGKLAGGANDYIRVGYTPTTTIPGHTMLGLQASMSFGDAVPALTDGRTFLSATPVALGAGELFASSMAFSPSGALTVRYAETGATGGGPAITHTGTRWSFRGDIADPLSPEPSAKAARAAKGDPTGGQLTVDFNGGEFKITGPIIELEGAYEISIEKRRLTECLKAKGLIDQNDYDDLIRFADGALVLKGLTTAADKASLGYGDHLKVMDAVMSGAWEKRVTGGKIGIVDQIANPAWGFDLLQDDEYQMLWLAQLCNEKDPVPEPEYDDKGNYKPSKYIKELLQSFDPNEKYGTQGGGAMHAVRSDRPLDYTVGFQNLPTASAAAQTVTVTDTLDPSKVDIATFSLGPIAFGGQLLSPPAGVTAWTKTVDLRPGKDMLVKVEAALTGDTVKWTFTTLDPLTLAKTTDVTAGFLPPSGEGSVAYSVAPKAGIATGTAIAGGASIVFDTNAPIATNVWSNLIDDVAPTGSVTSLKRACDSLTATWSGSDAASGVGSYDVWVSVDGGAYKPFRINTTDTSAAYPATAGHTYAFDVQARDFAGNLQSPNRADAVGGSVDCPPVVVQPGGGQPPQQPPPPTTTPPVTTPKVWVKLGKVPSRLRKNALAVPVICPATETAGCKGKLKLTTVIKRGKRKATMTLGSATFKVKAGKTGKVSVKLSKAALKLLKKGSLKVSLSAVAADKRTTTSRGKLVKVKK